MNNKITDYINKLRGNLDNLLREEETIKDIAYILMDARENDNTVFICGNGGSSATASHMAQDFKKMCNIKSYALSDNTPSITAWANDESYDVVFSQQLEVEARPRDVLIVISGSGNSPNIVNAVEWAVKNGVTVIALIGMTGGVVKEKYSDKIKLLYVDTDMQHAEDIHLIVGHLLLKLVE